MTREIDARIAQEVFGWQRDEHGGYETPTGYRLPDEIPSYSTDIRAAWEVVERLRPLRYKIEVYETDPEKLHGAGHMVTIWRGQAIMAYAHAETPMLAICLAALQVAGTPPGG